MRQPPRALLPERPRHPRDRINPKRRRIGLTPARASLSNVRLHGVRERAKVLEDIESAPLLVGDVLAHAGQVARALGHLAQQRPSVDDAPVGVVGSEHQRQGHDSSGQLVRQRSDGEDGEGEHRGEFSVVQREEGGEASDEQHGLEDAEKDGALPGGEEVAPVARDAAVALPLVLGEESGDTGSLGDEELIQAGVGAVHVLAHRGRGLEPRDARALPLDVLAGAQRVK